MMDTGSTIIIPMYRQPHLLLQCVQGIIRHSSIKHRIIVPFSDGIERGDESDVSDWYVDAGGRARREVASVREIAKRITRFGAMCGHLIRFMDVTDRILREGRSTWVPETMR